MICFGELLIKRDVLEKTRIIVPAYQNKITLEILAVDLRISRVRI
jgi:hypothetical protein